MYKIVDLAAQATERFKKIKNPNLCAEWSQVLQDFQDFAGIYDEKLPEGKDMDKILVDLEKLMETCARIQDSEINQQPDSPLIL